MKMENASAIIVIIVMYVCCFFMASKMYDLRQELGENIWIITTSERMGMRFGALFLYFVFFVGALDTSSFYPMAIWFVGALVAGSLGGLISMLTTRHDIRVEQARQHLRDGYKNAPVEQRSPTHGIARQIEYRPAPAQLLEDSSFAFDPDRFKK